MGCRPPSKVGWSWRLNPNSIHSSTSTLVLENVENPQLSRNTGQLSKCLDLYVHNTSEIIFGSYNACLQEWGCFITMHVPFRHVKKEQMLDSLFSLQGKRLEWTAIFIRGLNNIYHAYSVSNTVLSDVEWCAKPYENTQLLGGVKLDFVMGINWSVLLLFFLSPEY